MLDLNDYRAYVALIEQTFTEITSSEVVMDDSQMNKFLANVKVSDGHILLGLIPAHKPVGSEDFIRSKDTSSFLILKKAHRSDEKHEQFLDRIRESQQLAKKVWLKLLDDKTSGGENCNMVALLDLSSMDINPVYGFSGCDGYEIDFSLETHL